MSDSDCKKGTQYVISGPEMQWGTGNGPYLACTWTVEMICPNVDCDDPNKRCGGDREWETQTFITLEDAGNRNPNVPRDKWEKIADCMRSIDPMTGYGRSLQDCVEHLFPGVEPGDLVAPGCCNPLNFDTFWQKCGCKGIL